MMNKHSKSPCCGVRAQRFGKRRRRCPLCGITWRIRHKKRGRKIRRRNLSRVANIVTRSTISSLSYLRNNSADMIRKRANLDLEHYLKKTETCVSTKGKLILIIDAAWIHFKGYGYYTLYLVAVRSIHDEQAYFLDPVFLPDKENRTGWIQVLDALPEDITNRVLALISDGLRGIKGVAQERGWLFQRCQFHLLAKLQNHKVKGQQRGSTKLLRRFIVGHIKIILSTRPQKERNLSRHKLIKVSREEKCPKYLRMCINEFLRNEDDFITYRQYPKYNLPTTSNTVETMIRLLRKMYGRMHGFKTPNSLLKWSTALIRTRKSIKCRGKNQPN